MPFAELNSKGYSGNMNATAENVLDMTAHAQGHNKNMTTNFLAFFSDANSPLSFKTHWAIRPY